MILEQVEATISRQGLLAPGARVLVAYSGGADSTALALVLADLGYQVVLGHFDHRMQAGSARFAAHCRRVAALAGLPLKEEAAAEPPRSEAAARALRYEALARIAARAGAGAVATGHTLDDQAETVLLRYRRGGYPMGIPPRRGSIVRPLLGTRRSETQLECLERGMPFVIDPANADEALARNFIRHRVLAGVDGEVVRRLAAIGELAWQRSERGRQAAEALCAGLLSFQEGRVHLSRSALGELPDPMRRSLLRSALSGLGVSASARLVSDICGKILPATGAALDLPGGLAAWCEAGALVIGARPALPHLPAVALAVPGRTAVPEWGVEVVVEEVSDWSPASAGEALLDPRRLADGLVLRARRPGDRMRIPGLGGTKKLQDILVDRKVSRMRRDGIAIVASGPGGNQVVWLPGYQVDERFQAAEGGPACRVRIRSLLPAEPGAHSMARL